MRLILNVNLEENISGENGDPGVNDLFVNISKPREDSLVKKKPPSLSLELGEGGFIRVAVLHVTTLVSRQWLHIHAKGLRVFADDGGRKKQWHVEDVLMIKRFI